jgi:hypothetical protein
MKPKTDYPPDWRFCVRRKSLRLLRLHRLLWTPLAEKETSLVKKYTVSLECSDPLELWLLWSNMDSTELLQALLASGMSLYLLILELWLLWTPMDSSGLLSQAGSVTLSKTQTPMDSNGLSWTPPASFSFWLELVSTYPRTLTPMNSYGLLWSFLSYLVSYSF